MDKETHLTTIKIPYTSEDETSIYEYRRVYSIVLRSLYNRLYEDKKFTYKKSVEYIYSLNNLDLVNCHLINSAFQESKQLLARFKDKKIVFGTKKNFLDLLKGLISKDTFKEKRLSPLYSIGESNQSGNRFFRIKDSETIIFQPNRKTKIELNIKYRNKDILNKLKYLQNNKLIPITYKMDSDFIYITYDLKPFKVSNTKPIKNRVMSVDLNPDSIGLVVLDWLDDQKFKYVHSEVIDFSELNNKEIKLNKSFKTKRHSELFEVTHHITRLAKHFRCELFSIEDLEFKDTSKFKSSKTNRKNNSLWNRNKIVSNLEKIMYLNDIKVIKVRPEYSSFVGNIVFNNLEDFCVNTKELKLPDMCLSAIEIGRRGYEFYNQYIVKSKSLKKNLIFIELSNVVRNHIIKSMEEFNYVENSLSIKDLFKIFKKNSKWRYRVPLDKCLFKVFRFRHTLYSRYLFT